MKSNKYSSKNHLQRGQASKILIILAALVLLGIVIAFVVTRINATRKQQAESESSGQDNEPPLPLYDATIGDVKFLFQRAVDLGNVLQSTTSYGRDLTTTERFIKVTIGAQNKGKNNIDQYSWDLGNIIDSEGRNFVPSNQAYDWLPRPDLCGALLKPEFEPVPCIKIYEVSKQSKDLKIEVLAAGEGSTKKQKALLDIKVTR